MEIAWIERDFDQMTYNPFKVPMSHNILDTWVGLGQYAEFRTNVSPLNINNLVRYIAYMYDKGSPIYQKIDNIHKQKIEAAKLAGFKQKAAGTFSKYVDEMLVGENHLANHMIIRFLRTIHDESFMQFRIYKEKLYTSLYKMNETDDPKKLAEIISVNKSLTSVIDTIKREFVREDDVRKLVEIMYEQAEFEDLELTPEIIAERIQQGKDPVDYYPYGKDYKFEKYDRGDESDSETNSGPISGSG